MCTYEKLKIALSACHFQKGPPPDLINVFQVERPALPSLFLFSSILHAS